MAASGGYPKWLLDSKENITKGKEWSGFVEELFDAIQQQLRESHVQDFTDLTDAERTLFMERAARAIHRGNAYGELYNKCSVALDQHLNNEVARQLLEDHPINTKSDLILDSAQEGIISLLQKWPDMKSKLHIYLNQPLHEKLRQLAWKLYLDNPKVRKVYVDLLMNNPRTAISPQDLDISRHCEKLLQSEKTFEDLRGSVGAFYAMKAVLSYHHAMKKTKDKLPEVDYMLTVPFVYVALNNLSKSQPAASHVVALLVEEYFTFMNARPGYVVNSGSDFHKEEMRGFAGKVARHLQEKTPLLAKSLARTYVPSSEKIVATEASNLAVLIDAVISLCTPVISNMFVSYLRLPVVTYIWDQYMIGMDAPGFHDDLLPAIMAIYLMLLQDKLKEALTPKECEAALKPHGLRLKIPQFQYEFNKHFFKDMYAALNQDDKAALPVLDPTQAQAPPWIHWWSERTQPRTTPGERQKRRDEREAERQRLEQQKDEEARRLREEEQRRNEEEGQMMREQAARERRRNEEERAFLERKLEEERRRRAKTESDSAAEIARLQRELDNLRPKKRDPDAISLDSQISRYLVPPPPSVASKPMTPPPIARTITPSNPSQLTDTVLQTFIRQTAFAFQKVGHGEGEAKKELDRKTKDSIIMHKEDVKKAEVEVFGRQLRPGEFGELSPQEQATKSDQLMEVIRNQIQRRRQQDLAAGGRR